MNIKHRKFLSLYAVILTTVFATSANASLEYQGQIDVNGSGLGHVNTILTIQSPRNTTTETGSVAWNGATDVTTGNTLAINKTLLLGSLGSFSSGLQIVFNPSEPGNDNNGITLNNLVATIYSPTGAALWNSGVFSPKTFTSAGVGTGNSGFVFALDSTQAAASQSFWDGANRLGLLASASDATGGIETFYARASVTAVPEPATNLMFLSGLGLMGFVARRRSKNNAY